MAYLAVVASHTINGVAAIHSDIIKHTIFREFYDLWPEKFQNKTNGVTPRRWLAMCNPPMRALLTQTLGTNEWVTDVTMLQVRICIWKLTVVRRVTMLQAAGLRLASSGTSACCSASLQTHAPDIRSDRRLIRDEVHAC